MNTFELHMVTPDRTFPPREVAGIAVAALDGRLTVLAGHQPLVSRLKAGRLDLRAPDGRVETWATGEGTLIVERAAVTLLIQTAEETTSPAGPLTRPPTGP